MDNSGYLPTIEDEAMEPVKKVEKAQAKEKPDGFEPPNLGKAIRLPVVDFSNPNRPPTCLEVDFPIAPINVIANLEGNAGKPVYQMSKWWARRRSSVFRSMLIASATKAPEEATQAGGIDVGGGAGDAVDTSDLPVLENAEEVTAMAGFLNYYTPSDISEVIDFYRQELPATGWQENVDQGYVGDDNAMLSFTKEGQTMMLTIVKEDNRINVIAAQGSFVVGIQVFHPQEFTTFFQSVFI